MPKNNILSNKQSMYKDNKIKKKKKEKSGGKI